MTRPALPGVDDDDPFVLDLMSPTVRTVEPVPHQVIELQPEPRDHGAGYQLDNTGSSRTALIVFSLIVALFFVAWLLFRLNT